MMQTPSIAHIVKECRFTTARSGGPGGQHVNKVNSKVVLKWNVDESTVLDDDQKAIVSQKLQNHINKEGEIVLASDGSRRQLQNKEAVIIKLSHLLDRAFRVRKVRKPTKPSRSSVLKRLDQKAKQAKKKQWRGKIE
jgi:ribosome-associated protein